MREDPLLKALDGLVSPASGEIRRSLGKLVNRSDTGSKRTIAFAAKSVSHTWSFCEGTGRPGGRGPVQKGNPIRM